MRTRRTSKAVVAILAAVAALLLSALPASANTVDADITDGTLDLFQMFDNTPFLSFDLGDDTGFECPPTSGTDAITLSGGPSSGPVSGTLSSDVVTEVPGSPGDYIYVTLHIDVNADPSGNPAAWFQSPKTASGTIEAVAYIKPADDAEDCDNPEYDPCYITASNITYTATIVSKAALPTLSGSAPADTITINGSNSDFDTTVTGDANSCGALIAVDNGHVELIDVVLTVL